MLIRSNDPRNSYDPLSNSHPLPGSQPRRNGGYAWGVTTHGDEIWYGAFMNGWCLWLQPAGLPAPTEATADFYNFQSPINACDLRSEEHTSELKSLMRISYAVFCL